MCRDNYDQFFFNLTPKKINDTKFHILGIRPATPICVLKIGSTTHLDQRRNWNLYWRKLRQQPDDTTIQLRLKIKRKKKERLESMIWNWVNKSGKRIKRNEISPLLFFTRYNVCKQKENQVATVKICFALDMGSCGNYGVNILEFNKGQIQIFSPLRTQVENSESFSGMNHKAKGFKGGFSLEKNLSFRSITDFLSMSVRILVYNIIKDTVHQKNEIGCVDRLRIWKICFNMIILVSSQENFRLLNTFPEMYFSTQLESFVNLISQWLLYHKLGHPAQSIDFIKRICSKMLCIYSLNWPKLRKNKAKNQSSNLWRIDYLHNLVNMWYRKQKKKKSKPIKEKCVKRIKLRNRTRFNDNIIIKKNKKESGREKEKYQTSKKLVHIFQVHCFALDPDNIILVKIVLSKKAALFKILVKQCSVVNETDNIWGFFVHKWGLQVKFLKMWIMFSLFFWGSQWFKTQGFNLFDFNLTKCSEKKTVEKNPKNENYNTPELLHLT
ncbi:hypothetical protein VP01_879g2 [Puccinia sorghi]|uniref:Uncharacterized protein n=1 Tax=Puccinia sorghi TaxID=27349 RepID=A0A0L6UAJ7_9BASI|nr:hypothetical protein VP01_879g2 [Puccinia sorghi]